MVLDLNESKAISKSVSIEGSHVHFQNEKLQAPVVSSPEKPTLSTQETQPKIPYFKDSSKRID